MGVLDWELWVSPMGVPDWGRHVSNVRPDPMVGVSNVRPDPMLGAKVAGVGVLRCGRWGPLMLLVTRLLAFGRVGRLALLQAAGRLRGLEMMGVLDWELWVRWRKKNPRHLRWRGWGFCVVAAGGR